MSVSGLRFAIAGALLLVLGVVNYSIFAKERIRAHGERVLLELAPVDPRSLMQGDYMALRFTIANQIRADTGGTVPVVLDANRVAQLDPQSRPESLRLRYRIRQGQVWLGTNAYFFEEGDAERFAGARYGEFRVDRDTGEAVLVDMVGPDFKPL
jgi:uncharacterized membrane-anchored protein